jgi:hypothetical protein
MGGRAARTIALGATVLAAVAALGLSSAEATRIVRIPSRISIHSHGLTFKGKVTSRNHACVNGRKVTLHRTNGDVLGTTTTASAGRWRIRAQGSAGIRMGHFFAKVKRLSEGTAGTIYVCQGAKSKTIPFHA